MAEQKTEPEFSSRADRRKAQRHSSAKPVALAAIAALALGGGVYAVTRSGGDKTSTAQSAKDCTEQLPIVAPESIATPLSAALRDFSTTRADGCTITAKVTATQNTAFLNQIKSGNTNAMTWFNDSSVPFEQASKIAGRSIKPGRAIASTPVVAAGTTEQLKTFGDKELNWGKAMKANPPLTAADASNDMAAATAITSAAGKLGPSDDVKKWLGNIAFKPTNTLSAAAPHLATESQVIQHNASGSDKLAETALEGGSPLLTITAANLSVGDPDSDASYAALTKYLTSPQGQQALGAHGFRSVDGKKVPSGAPAGASGLKLGPAPSNAQIAKTLAAFAEAAKPLRLTALIDVSGSMRESTDGVSRIDAVSQTALAALNSLPPNASLAVWEFSTALDGQKDYKEIVPMVSVADPAKKKQLEDAAKRLPRDLKGDTGLYDSIWAAYQSAQKDFKPGQISSIAVITDGKNDDTTGGLKLNELLDKIKKSQNPNRMVDISPVAIGTDVDMGALKQIADLTHGSLYQAKTPQDIGAQLTKSLFDRSSLS